MLLSFLNPTCKFWKWLLLLTVQLAADPDPNVKNGAELLDRLIKVSNMTVSLLNNSRVLSLLYVEIHYFHIDHYAPYLPPLPPPPKKKKEKRKNCMTFVSNFSLVLQLSQEKSKTMVMQIFFFFVKMVNWERWFFSQWHRRLGRKNSSTVKTRV